MCNLLSDFLPGFQCLISEYIYITHVWYNTILDNDLDIEFPHKEVNVRWEN